MTEKWCGIFHYNNNNSHTSSIHIDLYEIPHIFCTRIIHPCFLRTATGYYWYICVCESNSKSSKLHSEGVWESEVSWKCQPFSACALASAFLGPILETPCSSRSSMLEIFRYVSSFWVRLRTLCSLSLPPPLSLSHTHTLAVEPSLNCNVFLPGKFSI